MSELEEKIHLIQDEKNNKVKPENIKEGVQMFGVLGRLKGVDTSDATANASDILAGKTAYKNGQVVTGTMKNNGVLNYSPGSSDQTIPEGYTAGGVVKATDITNSADYDLWIDLTNQILGESSPSIPVYKGLILCLENKAMTASSWSDEINNKTVSISNSGGVSNNALYFNGYTQFDSTIPHSKMVNGYTVITRINPSSWGNYKGIAGLHGNPGKGMVLWQWVDGIISSGHIDSTITQLGTALTINDLPTNTWNITTTTYDKGNGTGITYVNKEERSRSASFGTLTPDGNLIVGKGLNASNRYFHGYMSHFLVYDRPLSPEELSEVIDYINKRVGGN